MIPLASVDLPPSEQVMDAPIDVEEECRAWEQVDAGASRGCGRAGNGRVECWGENSYGMPAQHPDVFQEIAAGRYHACGIDTDGDVQCWGGDDYGQANPPPGRFVALSASHFHSCGIHEDGSVVCWGALNVLPPNNITKLANGPGSVGTLEGPFDSVSTGTYHSCALTPEGSAVCWGKDTHGQSSPPEGGVYKELDVGWRHTCGLTTAGDIECWGDNLFGQSVNHKGPYIQVEAGDSHTCGLGQNGDLECWGNGGRWQSPTGRPLTSISVRENAGPGLPLRVAYDLSVCGVTAQESIECWTYKTESMSKEAPPLFRLPNECTSLTAGRRNQESQQRRAAVGAFLNEAVAFSGYAEFRGTYSDQDGTPWTATQRLRPTLELASPNGRFRLVTTVEASITEGRLETDEVATALESQSSYNALFSQLTGYDDLVDLTECGQGCGLLRERSYDSREDIENILSMERLFLDVNLPWVDLRAGRQAINWGSALVYHPTDVFAQFLVDRPWQEPQGVNGFRLLVPAGELVQLTAAGGVDRNWENPKVAGKSTFFLGNTDISQVVSTDGETLITGVDFKGNLGVGWWFEAARADEIEAVFGIDYSLPLLSQFYIAVEGYYNGYGSHPDDRNSSASGSIMDRLESDGECDEDVDLQQGIERCIADGGGAAGQSASSGDGGSLSLGGETDSTYSGSSQLQNVYYLVGVVTLGLTEDLSLNNTAIWSIQDNTTLLFPYASYLVGSRFSFNAGAQVFLGEDGEFHPDLSESDPLNLPSVMSEQQLGLLGYSEYPTMDLSGLVPRYSAQVWIRVSL